MHINKTREHLKSNMPNPKSKKVKTFRNIL